MPPLLIQLRFCFLMSAFSFTFGILYPYETVPSRGRQIGSYTVDILRCMSLILFSFRPLARLIGRYTVRFVQGKSALFCFRPLSRLIGSYTDLKYSNGYLGSRFRPLARLIGRYTLLSHDIEQGVGSSPFTSPIEVDRQIYFGLSMSLSLRVQSFRPLARLIGIYTVLCSFDNKIKGVSGPSRGRQGAILIPAGHLYYDIILFPAPLEVDRQLYLPSTS